MDGDPLSPTSARAATTNRATDERGDGRRTASPRPHVVRWFVIVGLLLAIVLGGLYEFNRFRAHAIANFFAHNKPPPAEISAVTVTSQSVPRFAPGIGSLIAVHQVTVNPEVAGRVTKIFFHPGETVKAGDPLVQLNDAPDLGDLANYEAQARLAEITLARSKELVKRQFTPQETVDQNQSQLDQMKALVQKTQAIIAQKLIRAPFSGQLGLRQIDLGQYLNAGAPIVTLTDLSMLYVNFTLPSQQRSEIAVGQEVRVTSDAYPGRVFMAKLTTIEPQLSPDTRTIEVQATMPNPDGALLPGMFVNAAIVLPPQPDMMVVPETAVEYTLYGDSVYVIRPEGKDAHGHAVLRAVRTPVKTGDRWGDKVAILSGLKPGEEIVAAGQVKLQSGSQVAITGSPPPQPPAHPTLH
ncbi:MAG TPA: efflux RND transporter periplasmic adaptor subunit [Stellaceae bacterium]|nr:efflux RND transporter periplasmic adaptor subunit [Stellaceae bacterium]